MQSEKRSAAFLISMLLFEYRIDFVTEIAFGEQFKTFCLILEEEGLPILLAAFSLPKLQVSLVDV